MDKLNSVIVDVLKTHYYNEIPMFAPSVDRYRNNLYFKLQNSDLRGQINNEIVRELLNQKIIDIFTIAEKVMTDYCENFIKSYNEERQKEDADNGIF